MSDRTLRVKLEAITTGYRTQMASAQAQTRSFTQNLEKNALRNRQAFQTMGLAGVALGGAIGLGFKKAGDAALDFESSFAGIRKTVNASEGEFSRMAAEMRELAPELGVNVNELNAIGEEAGQLGIESGSIVAFTETIAKLRETTDLVDAAPLARLMNIMQTSHSEIGNLGAAVADLGNNGASTESEIVDMAQALAGAANIVGMSEADVLSYGNALASVGENAEAAGTSMSRVMLDMDEAVQGGGEKLKQFAEVSGMSASEFQTAFEDDAAGAIATFIQGLGAINDSGGNVAATLRDLGFSELRVRRALLKLAGSGDLLVDSLELGNKAMDEGTALNEEFAKRMDTNRKKIDQAKAELNEFAITIGGILLPAIGKVAETSGRAFGGMADAIDDIPGPVQQLVVALTGLVGAGSALGGTMLLLAPKIVDIKDALARMPALASSASTAFRILGRASTVASVGLFAISEAMGLLEAIEERGFWEGWKHHALDLTKTLGDWVPGFEIAGEAAERELRKMEGATVSTGDAFGAIGDLALSAQVSVKDFSGEVQDAGTAIRVFAGMTEDEFSDWRNSTRGAINSVEDVLQRFAGKTEVSSERILRAFSKQVSRMKDYEDNWRKLLRRDLPDSLTQQLQEMGVEGAGIVDALANANDREFEKIIRKWLAAEGVSKKVSNSLMGDFDGIAGKVRGAADDVRSFGTQLHNLPNSVNVDMKVTGQQIGDGPGRITGGGSAVAWAQQSIAAVPGPQYITSTYRSPSHNAAVGGSPTSYHMDRNNPAADIGGTNLGGIYNYLTRFPVRELIHEGDHVHVADQGGIFKGPGIVRMGAGYETFASGLRPAQRVAPTPANSRGGTTIVQIRPAPGMPDLTDWIDARVVTGIDSDNDYQESRARVSR